MAEVMGTLIHNDERPVLTEPLIDRLWPKSTPKKSRSALNTVIWRLNQLLLDISNNEEVKIVRDKEQIILQWPATSKKLDFNALKNTVHQLELAHISNSEILSKDIVELVRVLDDYKGDFLPTLNSDWVIIARERYRSLYIRGCQIAMSLFADQSNYERAISFAKKILVENPFRENTRRQLIWLYVMNGQRAEAARAYKETEHILLKELGVTPMAETVALLMLIKNESTDSLSSKVGFNHLLSNIQSGRHSVFKDLMLLSE